jgi:hypothetical protein
MGDTKSVVIKLTNEQKVAIKHATGKDISELRVDALEGRITPGAFGWQDNESRKAPTGLGAPSDSESRKAPTGLGAGQDNESRKAPTGLGAGQDNTD